MVRFPRRRQRRCLGSGLGGPRCHVPQRPAGLEGRGVQNVNGRIDVATENPVRHPCRGPTHRDIPNWQENETSTRKLPGGRVSGGTANEAASVRRITQVPHEGGSVVDGALPDVAKGVRSGGGNDQATSLGQGDDAGESRKPAYRRHLGPSIAPPVRGNRGGPQRDAQVPRVQKREKTPRPGVFSRSEPRKWSRRRCPNPQYPAREVLIP